MPAGCTEAVPAIMSEAIWRYRGHIIQNFQRILLTILT